MADNKMKYWDSGFPFGGNETTNATGKMKYWESGFPYIYIFQTTTAGTTKVYAFIIG